MPYIPLKHQKYDILPISRKDGGEVFSYSSNLELEIREMLPNEESVIPYGYDSYDEFNAAIDNFITKYGTENGNLNKLGKLLVEYKDDIKRRNIKEDWSILRYHGKTTSSFTNSRYYYCPCSADSPEYEGIITDEEFTSYLASIGNSNKAYNSLEDAANDGVTEYVEQNSEWEIVEDPTGMMTRLWG
jgi:hypothetical protein